MRHGYRFILPTVSALLIAVLAVGALLWHQAEDLARHQEGILEETILGAKRQELEHSLMLALTALQPLYASGRDDAAAKEQARAILRSMNYGTDGYFFVYRFDGTNEVHPRLPELEGKNLWDMRDRHGVPVIRELIGAARAGGGFVRYHWEKPSTGEIADKLSYAVMLERWQWMIGTGVYLDDLAQASGQIRDAQRQNIRETMLVLAAMALLALLLIACSGIASTLHETQQANLHLKSLNQRIVTLQEEERCRVARELHDGVGQLLISAKYHLEIAAEQLKAPGSSSPPALTLGIERIAGAVAEIRAISHDLRSAALDNLGLAPALDQLAREFEQRTGIAAEVRWVQPPLRLPGELELTLFRVAQEALTNIERHAGASRIELQLERSRREMQLCVSDDGRGLDTEQARAENRGIGLRNLSERAAHLGGSLFIVSAPGSGTRLTCRLPLPAASNQRRAV